MKALFASALTFAAAFFASSDTSGRSDTFPDNVGDGGVDEGGVETPGVEGSEAVSLMVSR